MMGEQTPLSTLENDRKRIEEILGLLDVERELALRADLAVELVRETSIIQDSLERGLYPFLEERGETIVVQQMRLSSEHVREAMRPVYDATRHTVPINVHTNNPAQFEHDLERLRIAVKSHLREERTLLAPAFAHLDAADRHLALQELTSARRRALGEPDPPQHRVTRWIARLTGRSGRLHDTASEYRPGLDRLEEIHGRSHRSTSRV